MLEEIGRIKEIWKHPFIEFADDNTFVDKVHSRELVRALIPEGLRWFTESDISEARDPQLLGLLKESGCGQILIGLESPSLKGLDGLESVVGLGQGFAQMDCSSWTSRFSKVTLPPVTATSAPSASALGTMGSGT